MTYNCETKEIIFPIIKKPGVSITELYVTKTCCGTPEKYVYCNEEQSNLLDIYFTIDNLQQIKEEPELDCYIEMTWDERINVDTSLVLNFVGTKESYISGILQSTEDLDLSYFNTIHSIYTISSQADREYIYDLKFELTNGITIYYTLSYNTNVSYFSDSICSIIDFNTFVNYDYTCLRNFTIQKDGLHFPLDLVDGFYSAEWNGQYNCFIVECDESLACKVKNFIEEKFNKNCYNCNKKKDLETYMKILMYYKALNSDCLDCCARCNAYEKMINITKGCHDC